MKFVKYLLLVAVGLAGCSGTQDANNTPAQTSLNGQYTIVMTSTKGNPNTNVYSNLSTSGTTLTGANTTLACPGNDLTNCGGDDPPALVFNLTGSITGSALQASLVFANGTGSDTASYTGTVNDRKGMTASGTYTDSQGDAGNWTATLVNPLTGNYTGTLQPSSNPTIPPSVSLSLTQTSGGTSLTGTMTVTNWACFSSLSFTSGEAIGGAFTLSNTNPSIFILAVPTSSGYQFQYSVGQIGTCSGDSGRGTVTKQ